MPSLRNPTQDSRVRPLFFPHTQEWVKRERSDLELYAATATHSLWLWVKGQAAARILLHYYKFGGPTNLTFPGVPTRGFVTHTASLKFLKNYKMHLKNYKYVTIKLIYYDEYRPKRPGPHQTFIFAFYLRITRFVDINFFCFQISSYEYWFISSYLFIRGVSN